MKIKKIKLLKALALTGAFGIVATVPVIVSSCSSTSDNNGNSDNNPGGQGDGGQQQTEVTPTIKTEVSLSGALSKIYDGKKTTSDLIAEDIKANPTNYFDNGDALKELIKDATVSVNGGFTESTFKGETYDVWSKDAKKGTYPQSAAQLNIKSINDLETQLGDSKAIQTLCESISSLKITNGSDYKVEKNALKLDGDLLHVNITAKEDGKTDRVKMDLAIPVSDLNLKIDDLKISVNGTGIKTSTDLTTKYTFNVGIDNTVKTITGAKGVLAENERKEFLKVMKALGYTDTAGTNLDNDKLSDALGLYNCSFEVTGVDPVTGSTSGEYTIKLKATPNKDYVWEDGTNTPKTDVSFVATLSNS
ncbi:P35 lipoprotein homolog [Malacoplasma penetrans HF-2]|uniref:P35 lipoprotein homolog n=1 Tax=Malacoplasma penetrans (strain HF-2) TaxID=272633 RepID=Q8EV85_MALP2|nr:P35 family lipoprotein [Malacoplasma penetrans]BAC44475.1 P35 lipoprotein homolog [Malacoplasma penetrans HF-2]